MVASASASARRSSIGGRSIAYHNTTTSTATKNRRSTRRITNAFTVAIVLTIVSQEVHCFNLNQNNINNVNNVMNSNKDHTRRQFPIPTSTVSTTTTTTTIMMNSFPSPWKSRSQLSMRDRLGPSRRNSVLRMVTGPKGKAANSKEDDMEKTVSLILQHDDNQEKEISVSSSSGLKEKLSLFLGGRSTKSESGINGEERVKKNNAVEEPELVVEMERSAIAEEETTKEEAEETAGESEAELDTAEEQVEDSVDEEVTINGDAEAITATVTTVESTDETAAVSKSSKITNILSALTSCFPLFVLSAAIAGFKEPQLLSWVNRGPIIPIMLGAVMTFMGMTLSTRDFQNLLSPSKDVEQKQSSSSLSSVPIGVLCQYLIMPLSAYTIGSSILLPSHAAAFLGLLLVGCSPGGTASNLVSLIAKADVALSVVLTSASTLLASVLTPLLVKTLIGSTISISGKVLCKATAQVILGPILLGMAIRKMLPRVAGAVGNIAPFAGVVLVSLLCGGVVAQNAALFLAGGAAASDVALLKKIVLSVLGLHSIGFLVGYAIPRKIFGLSERSARTISIETGMQNSALAVVLAKTVVSTIDAPSSALMSLAMLPGAISATAHSCLGSALAVYWRFVDAKRVEGASGAEEKASESASFTGIEGTTIVEEDSGSGI